MKNFISVPFKIDDQFTKIAGMGKFSPAGIILEYEGKLFGIIKNGVREARISSDEILDIRFKKGIFKVGAKIEIRLKDFSKLTEMPNKNGKIILNIERADFERAQEAVANITRSFDEPPSVTAGSQTPVSRLFEETEEETKEF